MKSVLVGVSFALASAAATAGMVTTPVFVSVPVPTLDDVGLFALVALVGVVGGYIVRRRRK